MAQLFIENSRIAGIACTVPKHSVSTEETGAALGMGDMRRILQMTAIERRPVAAPEVCASDLCADAAGRLLEALGWRPESVEALIFVSQTPDYILPATACSLQKRLGLSSGAACFDINLGCSGYVYGLSTAMSLVEGGVTRALLLVGDTLSKIVCPQDRATALLFGDIGSATAIEKGTGRYSFVLGSDGHGGPFLKVPAGQSREMPTEANALTVEMEGGNIRSRQHLYMDGAAVMAFTLREVPPIFDRLLQISGLNRDELDAIVLHQANQFILDTLARRMKLPKEKIPSSLRDLGNTSCASLPATISSCLREKLSQESMRLAMIGFGVGWSWGGCIGTFGPMVLPEIGFYENAR